MNGHGVSALPHEAEAFQGEPAGLVTRGLGAVIDVTVVAAILLAMYAGFCAAIFAWRPRTFHFPALSGHLSLVVAAVVAAGYLAVGWWIAGRTYGTALMGLRVVNREDGHLRFVASAVRAAICICFPLGLAWCAIDSRGRGVHDLVVRSRVIYDWRPREG